MQLFFLLISVILMPFCSNRKQQLEKEIKTVEERIYTIESTQREHVKKVNEMYMPILKNVKTSEQNSEVLENLQKSKDSAYKLGRQLQPERDSLGFVLISLKKQYDDK